MYVPVGLAARLAEFELKSLALLANGKTQAEIAHELGVSLSSVNYSIRVAIRKLDARTPAQAVALAVATGLVAVEKSTARRPR